MPYAHKINVGDEVSSLSLDPSFLHGPCSKDFRNVPVDEAGVVPIQGKEIPWTVTYPNYGDKERSYVVSPYSHYIGYAYDEIRIHAAGNRLVQAIGGFLVWLLGLLVQLFKIDECLYFNNYLLPTNLWPDQIKWSKGQVNDANEKLLKILQGRSKAIVWRSVDPLSQPELFQVLSQSPDCLLVPARIANWIDFANKQVRKRSHLKRDVKLFREQVGWDPMEQKEVQRSDNSTYVRRVLPPEEMTLDIAKQVKYLYEQLYLDKYSRRNPQFTEEGITRMIRNGFITLLTLNLRSNPSKMLACSFCVQKDGVMTFPGVGYDRNPSADKNLYRLCFVSNASQSIHTGCFKTHLSAGVNLYKRNRGAQSTVEYNAVFIGHLPFHQKLIWTMTKAVLDKIITVEHAK